MCTAQVLSLGICLDFLGWSLVPWVPDPPALWTTPIHSPPLLLPVRDTVSHSAKLLWFSSPSSLLQTCLRSASLHLAQTVPDAQVPFVLTILEVQTARVLSPFQTAIRVVTWPLIL